MKTTQVETTTILFPNGNQARAVFSVNEDDVAPIIQALGISLPRAILLMSGGASDISVDEMIRMQSLIVKGIASVTAAEDIAVVDGGTQAGVMQMIGEGRAITGGHAPLIGVCPAGRVSWPGRVTHRDLTPLEPNHTHFVLTSGNRWGKETATMFALVTALSARVSPVFVLVNGGSVAKAELLHGVRQQYEIVVIQGSGRLADVIAAVCVGGAKPPDAEIATIAREGHITLFNINDHPEDLTALIRSKLFSKPAAPNQLREVHNDRV
jgi:hypothetical protein